MPSWPVSEEALCVAVHCVVIYVLLFLVRLFVIFFLTEKIHKKWGDLKGEIVRVDLDRTSPGGGALSTVSLGLSLAGHKDRTVMAVFICGLNPSGIAFKDGRLQVGDELVEVNGNVLHGRCHLNASAIIKSIGGARVTIIVLRREGALQEVAVPPITRFPISLEEQPPEERYSRFKNLRIITLKKVFFFIIIFIILTARIKKFRRSLTLIFLAIFFFCFFFL